MRRRSGRPWLEHRLPLAAGENLTSRKQAQADLGHGAVGAVGAVLVGRKFLRDPNLV